MTLKTFYILFFSLILFVQPAGADIALSLNQQQIGDTLNITIAISGLGDSIAPSLSAYDFDIAFDSSQLQFSKAEFGSQLNFSNLDTRPYAADLVSTNLINLYEQSLDSITDLNTQQSDSFNIATLYFAVLQTSTSNLTLTVNVLADAEGIPLTAPNQLETTITTVPLVPAGWLMLSGLIAINLTKMRWFGAYC